METVNDKKHNDLLFVDKNHYKHTVKRALIIEDQSSASLLLKSLLKKLDIHDVDVANNEKEALHLCHSKSYDLLIIDYHLNDQVTGSELLDELRQNKLISIHTACIIISGDNSHEVVISSIESKPDCFICKPVNYSSLKEKIEHASFEVSTRYPFLKIKKEYGVQEAINYGIKEIENSNNKTNILHSLLISYLIKLKEWERLNHVVNIMIGFHDFPQLDIATAHIEYQNKNLEKAEEILENLLDSSPFNLEAMDLLCEIKIKKKDFSSALMLSEKAMKLTPNNVPRILNSAKLSAQLLDSEKLDYFGNTLASHLHFQEKEWLVQIIRFVNLKELVYVRTKSNHYRLDIPKDILPFFKKVASRAKANQKKVISCFSKVVAARFELINNNKLNAKKQLFSALSPYFDNLNKLDDHLIIESIEPFMRLGEAELATTFLQHVTNHQEHTPYSTMRLSQINHSHLLKKNMLVRRKLQQAKELLHTQPKNALATYGKILDVYPTCSEAHLGSLDANYRLAEMDEHVVLTSFSALTLFTLPHPQDKWCSQLATLYEEAGLSSPLHKMKQGELLARTSHD
ncbi:response regulator [Vibrio sp. Of7-15]|uniref:response regulator n=1 Tax=Vibrio sp. Of7-15 TaxID=2724879 RepID=UPI001EF19981|nr:response regulator [Vibrio sp. Of7-15]MCG7498006.1 response regulator [Vibrio sp. Of7-15]